MKVPMLVVLLLAAQLNLTALVPLLPGDPPPPWWVGGRLLWPFAVETRTLVPPGDLLNAVTPILGVTAAICFLLAAAAVLGWRVPSHWFPWLVGTGAILSMGLHAIWISPWAILPLLIDVALLWTVFGVSVTVNRLRG